MSNNTPEVQPIIRTDSVSDVPVAHNERLLSGMTGSIIFLACVLFTSMHLYALNVSPIETWTFRILHVAGGLVVGFALTAAVTLERDTQVHRRSPTEWLALAISGTALGYAALCMVYAWWLRDMQEVASVTAPLYQLSWALVIATTCALLSSWTWRSDDKHIHWADWILMVASILVAAYLIFVVALIMELTRRVAGLALIVITGVFLVYAFAGPLLPGILEHQGYGAPRFFSYLYTDNGILGPTTAVSSTYIILFITFAAFLQASKVGDYFVNFAFAAAGRSRGGPAKVAVFASGLMGMINGTSAGNVVATGSLTIPLMKRVGYHPRSAGGIEAAASTGGQIVPPIMGAGAFIMAEITGIPYTDIAIAALIPAGLYFLSIYLMVDLEARRDGELW